MDELTFQQGLSLSEIIDGINELPKDSECFKGLGRLTYNYREDFQKAYNYFKKVNSEKYLNGVSEDEDNQIKGCALERLTALLFEGTGGFYKIYRNIKNGSNEIDLFLKLSDKGIYLSSLLKSKYASLLCECKNYKEPISVTYIGKFYSLMQSTHNNIGIMFSYKGFSGKNWGGAKGLTKKLFLLKENMQDKSYILEFTVKDFQDILDGKSIFNLLDEKCSELELGIDEIKKYIIEHPNEKKV